MRHLTICILVALATMATSAQEKRKLAEGDTLIAPSALVKLYDAQAQQRQQYIERSRQQIAEWEKQIVYILARRDEAAAVSDTLVVYKKAGLLKFQ